MADTLDQATRSRIMSLVRSKDTKPEKLVRSMVHRMGYRFRLHVKQLPGKPDLVLRRLGLVIFVNGCFWHQHPGCRKAGRPATNEDFWNDKLDATVKRDRLTQSKLRRLGWRVSVVWECETFNGNLERLRQRLSLVLSRAEEPAKMNACRPLYRTATSMTQHAPQSPTQPNC